MNLSQRLKEIRTGFNLNFWVANTLELFERLAFYGSKAVLSVFLATKVGLNEDAGTLAGLFSGVIYSLPIVAGVLVDRYGFKKTLMSCFAIFSVGYFLIGMAGMEYGSEIMSVVGKKNYVICVLMFTAIGGSLIKPCIVGTVSKTSKPDAKALGFSIYYTLVNFGGAIGPIIALNVREDWGIEYVLVMSAITSLLLFFGTWLFFKEPDADENEEKRTFGKVFSDMLLVFSNVRFILFLIIFSGFWLMFWQIFYSFPFYVTNILKYPSFEIMETIDAWCIIILTVPMAALAQKLKPITAMTLGFVFASLSWIIIGTGGTITAAIIGMALFALGEATQAPRFYEYVSALAPKGQVGTFMGFAFLPVAIGSFTAGPIADWLRTSYMEKDPAMMWFIVAGFGIVSTLLMILYNIFIARKMAVPE
jgi:POT family proton-dependent oligopeptide transporter